MDEEEIANNLAAPVVEEPIEFTRIEMSEKLPLHDENIEVGLKSWAHILKCCRIYTCKSGNCMYIHVNVQVAYMYVC